jgi:multidrug efflux system membrane fusion protein
MPKPLRLRATGPTLLGATAALLLAACSGAPADKPAAAAQAAATDATPVRIAEATPGPALPPITADGLLAHEDEFRLSFKVGGVVRRIDVQEGEPVRRGQTLAVVDLAEVGAQATQAREAAAKAARDLARGERLHADDVISTTQLEDLRTQDAVARAAVAAANFNLGQSTIVAPRDGVVLRRLAEERETVAPGTPVLVIGARDTGFVLRVALADRDVVSVARGDRATVVTDAHPGREIPARVSEVSAAADPRSGLFPVELALEPGPLRLASGMLARARIVPASVASPPLTYVPVAAVVEGDGRRAAVFVPAGDTVRRREVQVAFLLPGQVALAGGLAPGETVVTDGALYLGDGDRVRIVRD